MSVTRQRTIITTLDGHDRDPARVIHELQGMLHPAAVRQINHRNGGDSGVDRAVAFVRQRLAGFELGSQDVVRLSLNPYNDKGLGLQSVQIGLMRDGAPVLLKDEIDHPTIGVITDGLVDGAHVPWAVVGFTPDQAEEITSLSGHFLLDGVPESRVRFSTNDQPHLLQSGQRVVVQSPHQVRTIVQKAGVDPLDPANTHDFVNKGVFACRFVRNQPAV